MRLKEEKIREDIAAIKKGMDEMNPYYRGSDYNCGYWLGYLNAERKIVKMHPDDICPDEDYD